MFLIIIAVIITSLLILRFSTGTPSIERELRILRSKIEGKFFDNIVEELKKSEEFSYYEQDKIVSNVFNFANFTRRKMNERGLDFEFLYVGTLANNSNNQTNITLINFLNKVINATLVLNSSPQQTDSKSNIIDGSTWSTNFTFTPGAEYLLTLNYTYLGLTNVTEEIIVKTKSDKSIYVGFFDVSLVTIGERIKR